MPGFVLNAGDPKVYNVPPLPRCEGERHVNGVRRASMVGGFFQKLEKTKR